MSQNAHPYVVNALVEEFGANAGLALELYASYRLNPASVDEGWRCAFEAAEAVAAGRLEPLRAFTATFSAGPPAPGPTPEAPSVVPAAGPPPAPAGPAPIPG